MNAPQRQATSGKARAVVDFNIHNLIGIRLIDPSAHDVRIVEAHLGLKPSEFSGKPALTIDFVDRLRIDRPLRFLGRDDVGFTDNAFVILRSRNLARARTSLAMEKIGETCELTCETGLPAIPLLRQLLNLVMLARGIVPVHAAAFRHQERGVLVTGWSHGSKTGTLLAFMDAGAKFIGDEWIYLDASRDQMYGLPDQLEARPWYLDELPKYRQHVGLADRIRTGLTGRFARAIGPLADRSERRNSLSGKLIRYARQALADQQSVHLKPLSLFGADQCLLASPLDIVILAVSHDAEDIVVTPSHVEQVAGRMAASFVHEQASLASCYKKHLFAFPNRRNALLDHLEQVYHEQAVEALKGKQVYSMLHPYPVGIAALRKAVQPLLA